MAEDASLDGDGVDEVDVDGAKARVRVERAR
jgi:hypothetical protein